MRKEVKVNSKVNINLVNKSIYLVKYIGKYIVPLKNDITQKT